MKRSLLLLFLGGCTILNAGKTYDDGFYIRNKLKNAVVEYRVSNSALGEGKYVSIKPGGSDLRKWIKPVAKKPFYVKIRVISDKKGDQKDAQATFVIHPRRNGQTVTVKVTKRKGTEARPKGFVRFGTTPYVLGKMAAHEKFFNRDLVSLNSNLMLDEPKLIRDSDIELYH